MRVVFPIGSRANFGSVKSAMLACKRRGATVLPVLYASATDWRYGNVRQSVESDGHEIAAELPCHVDNAMAFTTGTALTQWAAILPSLRADSVLIVGDRHEQLAPAIAASYAGIEVVHQMAGEVSGNIDDKVRDAITALADKFCVATKRAADRVCHLTGLPYGYDGGAPNVWITGCPRIDMAKEAIGAEIRRAYEPIIMVSQHPVTTEHEEAYEQMKATLAAVSAVAAERKLGVELFWPNSDAGTDGTNKAIREFLSWPAGQSFFVRTHRAMSPEDYARMMASARVLVGNSSSGLREGAWIGTPVLDLGSRQRSREIAGNVINIGYAPLPYRREQLIGYYRDGILSQLDHGPYPSSTLYGDGTAGEKVADVILGTREVERVKRINEMVRRT